MDPGCEGDKMKKRANFKKSGPVASEDSWTHQHPNASGRELGALEQARKKLEYARLEQSKALYAALDFSRAERDYQSKKTGAKKYRTVPGFMVDQSTGHELSPEDFLAMRPEIMERYGYYLKDRSKNQKGRPFRMKLQSAPVEELAVECAPWVAIALENADKAGHDVLPVANEIFSGVAEEFERVTGFRVRFRARHPDEGILHEQLLWVKTDGEGKKLGHRPRSTHWWDIQFLYPAMLGARRWMSLVGRDCLGEKKAKGIDDAMAQRKKQCGGVFPVPPDVALADYVDNRTDGLRVRFPWFAPFLDDATAQYRQRVFTLLDRGKHLSDAFAEVRADLAPLVPNRRDVEPSARTPQPPTSPWPPAPTAPTEPAPANLDAPPSRPAFSIPDENLLPIVKSLMTSLLAGNRPSQLEFLLLAKDNSKPAGLRLSDEAKASVTRCLKFTTVVDLAIEVMDMADAFEVNWEHVVSGISKLTDGTNLTVAEGRYFAAGSLLSRVRNLAAIAAQAGNPLAVEAATAIEAYCQLANEDNSRWLRSSAAHPHRRDRP